MNKGKINTGSRTVPLGIRCDKRSKSHFESDRECAWKRCASI